MYNQKKKYFYLLLVILISLTGCKSSNNKNVNAEIGDNKFNIGIVQFMEHPALDHTREGFIKGLDEIGLNYNIYYENAHGEIPNCINISKKFLKDDMDLIFTIGTTAAQSTKHIVKDIPILFSAVTDPVESGLVDSWDRVGSNITGTSDRADIRSQLELFHKLNPDIKDIGIIYNNSETNSIVQIEEVESISKDLNLNIKKIGINNINDINKALSSLIGKIDAMYLLSDNMIASSAELISNRLIENNIISVSAEESQVENGMLITKGHSYYELGKQTSSIAEDILVNKNNIENLPVYLPNKTELVVNSNTLNKLDIDQDLDIFIEATMIKE